MIAWASAGGRASRLRTTGIVYQKKESVAGIEQQTKMFRLSKSSGNGITEVK